MMPPSFRRIAVSQLVLHSGERLHNQVVEIQSGRVVRHYPLTAELPHTEWHCATFIVAKDGTITQSSTPNNILTQSL